jgi:hypothetical protein
LRPIAMLIGYFDEAGGKDHGFTAVCGWVTHERRWAEFERDWRLLLLSYGVPYLHMLEMPQHHGPYAGWRGIPGKQVRFLRDAGEIIRSKVLWGFVFFVKHSAFDYANTLFEVTAAVKNPYALAARSCMEMVERWRTQTSQADAIQFIFGELDREQAALTAAMRTILPALPEPRFEPSRDLPANPQWPAGKSGVTRLQAVDYLAHECRKAMLERTRIGSLRHRQSLQAVVQTRFHMGGICSNKMMCRFCVDRGIQRKRASNSTIHGPLA